MRARLSNELAEVINEFGPKVYDDFDQVSANTPTYQCAILTSCQMRILVPSAAVPPSSGSPGLWRRKSSTGAVDAQGNLLAHPMVSLGDPMTARVDLIFVIGRLGLMSDCLAGVGAREGGRAHGLGRARVAIPAEPPHQRVPATRKATTTIFLVTWRRRRCRLVCGPEVFRVHMQICKSYGEGPMQARLLLG